MSNNTIRMSGMNSGLDVEALVEAMTANTKLKITKQERKAITLGWKQEAYQDITSKLTEFQNKYFDILNSKTNLTSKSTFNKYSATVSSKVNGVLTEGAPAGVTVKSNPGANPGTYDVKVLSTATQAKYQGSAIDTSSLDLSNYTDSSQTYSFNLTVGTESTTVMFNGGTADEVIGQINSQLTEAFGESNTTDATGRGLVYVSDSGKLVSSDRTAMSMSGVMNMNGDVTLNTSNLAAGTNKLNIQVGSSTYSVSFSTYSAEYFDQEDENSLGAITREEYQGIYFNQQVSTAYEAAKTGGTLDSEALKNQAYEQYKTDAYNEKYDSAIVEATAGYEEQLKADYDAGIADGTIADGISFDEWKKTQPDFDEMAFKVAFDEQYEADFDEEALKAEFEKSYDEYQAYKATFNAEDYRLDNETLADFANRHELEKAISGVKLSNGGSLSLSDDGTVTASNGERIAIAADPASANNFGASTATSVSSQVTTDTTLSQLGFDEDVTFSVNGVSFTFSSDYTVKKMMNEINANSTAGATMTFSTLTNSFSISSSDYGTAANIEFGAEDGSEGAAFLSTVGLTTGTLTEGRNLELEVNGERIETSSNSYTVDGTTMTFTSAAAGSEFTYEVKKDNSEAIEAVKSFVEDYNKILEEVYKYLDEKPNKDYYALTDDEIEEMDLSETQQEKWETMAKKGLLYNDSAVSSVMQKLRSVLYSTVKTADGQTFSLFSMGITTSDDWTEHGKLELDETALEEAFDKYSGQIEELFTGTTIDDKGNTVKTGIMYKLDDVLTSAVKTTGARKDKGTLVQLAGMPTGTASTDNSIYDQLKSIETLISSLEERYQQQQDRYWAQFSSLETLMGDLNSQTSYIQQLMSM